MKNILGIILIFILINSCSKIPKSAFECFDLQNNKRVFTIIFDKDWSGIHSLSDWVFDGISKYQEDFWTPNKKKPMFTKDGYVIRYFEDLLIKQQFKKFIIKKGINKGNTFDLPLTNYRNTYFELKTKSFEIYEYYHPVRVFKHNLILKEDNWGNKVNISFYKKFICKEEKDLYKKWKKSGNQLVSNYYYQ